MQCPHCQKDVKWRVLMSRQTESAVYRHRTCNYCGRSSYSEEKLLPVGEKMPAVLRRNSYDRRGEGHNPSTARVETAPRGDAAHIQGIWGGLTPKRDDD
jgi:hypothetical protein